MNPTERNDAIDGYLAAAGWLVSWDDARPEDNDTGHEGDHRDGPFTEAAYGHAATAVDQFANIAGSDDVRAYLATRLAHCGYPAGWSAAEGLGHDLWLTRNGHGAGFWDRGLGHLGERLSDAARSLGEATSYVLADGTVEVDG